MKFELTIQCNGAAFSEGMLHDEVARLLNGVKNNLEYRANGGQLRDINGNAVGRYSFIE